MSTLNILNGLHRLNELLPGRSFSDLIWHLRKELQFNPYDASNQDWELALEKAIFRFKKPIFCFGEKDRFTIDLTGCSINRQKLMERIHDIFKEGDLYEKP